MTRLLRCSFFLLVLLTSLKGFGGQRTISAIRLIADTSGAWFLSGQFQLGCEVKYINGLTRRTVGYLNGNMQWDNFIITSEQGKLKKGIFTIDFAKAQANNNTVVIEAIAYKDDSKKSKILIRLPVLKGITLLIAENQKLLPGVSFTPEVSFLYSNRRTYRSNPWSETSLVSGSELSLFLDKTEVENGVITIPADVVAMGDRITISAIWKKDKSIYDVKIYAVDFDYTEFVNFRPVRGADGGKGGNGGSNQAGGGGQSGMNGKNGPGAQVYMWLDADTTIINITVKTDNRSEEIKLKAGRGKLDINVRGGDGGDGGEGGTGGDGADGSGEAGGVGGNGGNGGDGGRGGSVEIWCDEKAEKYLPQLNINNTGGMGGKAGKGGRGGISDDGDGHTSIFEVLFPTRNYSGYDGYEGNYGQPGPEGEIHIAPMSDVVSKAKTSNE